MGLSVWHVVVVLVVVLILFGAGKLPQVMGDVAKGIKNFKAGMGGEDDKPGDSAVQDGVAAAPAGIAHQAVAASPEPAGGTAANTGDGTTTGGKS